MHKLGLGAAAALVATLPFMATSAMAQSKAAPGAMAAPAAPASPAVKGGGAMGGGGAAMSGGGAMGGGGGAISRGGGGGGSAVKGPIASGPRPGTGPQVGWSGGSRPGWQGGYHQRHRGHWRGRHWVGPGVGFGTGFLLGSTFAAQPYYGNYYEPDDYAYYYSSGTRTPDEIAYCQQRFRSYDVRSGTYLGYDGERHPCP